MFDREAFEGPYVLQVEVADNGVGISLSATAEVTVYLTDVNDNTPIFQPGESHARYPVRGGGGDVSWPSLSYLLRDCG